MERKEAYAKIKELNLQEECKKQYGKNFTQCKTDELVSIINSATTRNTVKTTKKSTRPISTENECDCGDRKDLRTSYKELIEILRSRHILTVSEFKDLLI